MPVITWKKVSAKVKKGIVQKDRPEQLAVVASGNQGAKLYRPAQKNRGNTDQLTYKLQEFKDGEPGEIYTLTLNAIHTKEKFQEKMKELILADRKKLAAETPTEEKIDVANFDTFLNS